MTMAAGELIDIPTACALALGQNIGTTITANLAAIGTTAVWSRSSRVNDSHAVVGDNGSPLFWNVNGKFASFARGAFHRHTSAAGLGGVLHDGEAQAGSSDTKGRDAK